MQAVHSLAARRALQGVCRSGTHTAPSSFAVTLSRSLSLSAHLLDTSRPTATAVTRGPGRRTPITQSVRHASSSSPPPETLSKTPLYDFHLAHGAKMVPFGGFYMPVQYSGLSVSQSHVFTREHASIFDVSHMVQRLFSGPGATAFLERVTPGGIAALGPYRSTLSALLHPNGKGGIVDDTIITRLPAKVDLFYVVTNAGCRDKDDAYFAKEMAHWNADNPSQPVMQDQLHGWGLVALQGPKAEAILTQVLDSSSELNLKDILFGQSAYAKLKLSNGSLSSRLLISRGGYTGEDGFEISIPTTETVPVTEALLAPGPEHVQLAGLGARDSLRLEAGMCLYGHDLNDTITPVEAGLSWIIPKDRRSSDAGYYGAERIASQLVTKKKGGAGVEIRRVGLNVEGAPAREGAEIVSTEVGDDGKPVYLGTVTSGCPSPTLGKNIAMGYIKDGFHTTGTEVRVLVRGRPRKAVVTKMPFVPTKYWKGAAPA